MSNKPKGVAIHPNNTLSFVEKTYNIFINNMINWAKNRYDFSKHIGSKRPNVLKQRINH